jgi:hypothetical protein
LAGIEEAEPPDALAVAFDVIYAGETWCRSVVWVDRLLAAQLEYEEPALVRAARDALLEYLALEVAPVSVELRLRTEGVSVLARGRPGPTP